MSDAVLVGILAALPPTLIALTGLIIALRSSHDLVEVKTQTNHLVTKALIAERDAGRGEGVATERVEKRARTASEQSPPPAP